MGLFATLCINGIQQWHSAYHNYFNVTLSVIMMTIIKLSVIMLSVVEPN
jgi:hypothetical protein